MLGDVGLELEAREFAPGSVLVGRFAFRLHQPKQCRQACIQLRAWENYVEYERDWSERHHHGGGEHYERRERSREVYEHTLVLSGEGSYQQGIHPFRLQIPAGAPSSSLGGRQDDWDPAGSVLEWVGASSHSSHHHGHHDSQRSLQWEVRGWLDIPWGSDPVAREAILVHPRFGLRRDSDWEAARGQPACNHHQPAYPPAPAPPPAGKARFCMHCGARALKVGARFCNSCGQPMA
jgi:hypothetical protein